MLDFGGVNCSHSNEKKPCSQKMDGQTRWVKHSMLRKSMFYTSNSNVYLGLGGPLPVIVTTRIFTFICHYWEGGDNPIYIISTEGKWSIYNISSIYQDSSSNMTPMITLPKKTSMTIENQQVEDVSPIQNLVFFSACHVNRRVIPQVSLMITKSYYRFPVRKRF